MWNRHIAISKINKRKEFELVQIDTDKLCMGLYEKNSETNLKRCNEKPNKQRKKNAKVIKTRWVKKKPKNPR